MDPIDPSENQKKQKQKKKTMEVGQDINFCLDSRHSLKYLLLCSEGERNSYRFGTT